MRIVIIGPGRAGGAIGLAALAAGHTLAGVVPGPSSRAPNGLVPYLLQAEAPLPDTDLLVVAARDDQIGGVASRLARVDPQVAVACHMSGFLGIDVLAPLARLGIATASFHPLQSLPTPERGALALRGSWVAVTGSPAAARLLEELAVSLRMSPFALEDRAKPAYHAAAAASSNFLVTALSLAEELFSSAGVPMAAARPLTESVIRNVFEMGARAALTGPVARGDAATVHGHLAAAEQAGIGGPFRRMVAATAELAGRDELLAELGEAP